MWFDEGIGRPENLTPKGKVKGFILSASLMKEMFIKSQKIMLENGDIYVQDLRAIIPKHDVLKYSF